MTLPVTQIAAHRGGAALWPENSPTAFRNAAGLAVEQVEFDVQLTRDGAVVIHHDADLDRTTSGTGPLGGKTLAELKELTLTGTSGDRIMTLDEGIDLLAPSGKILRCEIKPGSHLRRHDGLEAKVFAILNARTLLDRTIITSFQIETLNEVRAWPKSPQGLIWLVARPVLGCIGLGNVIELARGAGLRELGLHHRDIDETLISVARAAELECGAWAALEDEDIRRVLELGVKVFTTDRPDAALRIRRDFQRTGVS